MGCFSGVCEWVRGRYKSECERERKRERESVKERMSKEERDRL